MKHFLPVLRMQLEIGMGPTVAFERVTADKAQIALVAHSVPSDVLISYGRLLLVYSLQ